MAEQKSSSRPVAPLRAAASAVRRVPGAEALSRAGEGILDKVEAVSPRGRRLVVYTGAGVLGAVGVVEWPVALTGAAVVWLTQARAGQTEGKAPAAGAGSVASVKAHRVEAREKAPATASKRASTGRRKSATASSASSASTSSPARKKTAPAARRGTAAKGGTSTRTTKSGTSARTTKTGTGTRTTRSGTSSRTTTRQGRTTR
ncbi:hypothetical protein ACWEKM_21935 [Streptomyces sp. NPDC004752]